MISPQNYYALPTNEQKNLLDRVTAEIVRNKTRRALAYRDFLFFADYTNRNFIVKNFHVAIADALNDIVFIGNQRVYVGMPPRHGKSLMCSVLFPAWCLGLHPEWEIIHISYAASLSNDFSRQVREIIRNNPAYRELFPGTQLHPDKQKVDDWKTTKGGGFYSIGTGGGVTGHGGNVIVGDDLHKEGDAESPAALESARTWYATAANTRLSPGGSILIPMTRWAEGDVIGWLLETAHSDPNADQWREIVFPALALENDPLGRDPGQPLWPERFPLKRLLALRALSERNFEALFQQNPKGKVTRMFKRGDFAKACPLVPLDYANQSVRAAWCFDLAIKDKEANDYTTIGRWFYDRRTGDLWLTDFRRIRQEWVDSKRDIKLLMDVHPEDDFVFPTQTYELMAVQELRAEVPRMKARIQEVTLPGDKRSRAAIYSDRVASGHAIIVENGDVEYFIDEHVKFTGVADVFDDAVDNSSVATHWFGLDEEFSFLARSDSPAEVLPDAEYDDFKNRYGL